MKKFFFQKAIFSASVVSLAATMVFAVPAFAGSDFDYESGANYRYPSQRDYSQGSTSPFRHYQPDFNRSERDFRYGASEFPRTSRGYGENLEADRDFGNVYDRGYSGGSTYRDDTGYRGYYGDNPEGMNYDQYYEGRYGRPSYRKYRKNMQGRGGWEGADNQFGDAGQQEPYGQSRRRQQQFSRQQRQQGTSGRQAQQWQVDPQGWVRVGYDYDNDNKVDAYEWISYYELEKARKSSRMKESARRSGQEGQRYGTGMQRDRFERGYYQQRSGQQTRRQMRRGDQIQGSIKEMKTISLSKMDEDHVIARIRTQNGQVAKVDLGPERKISDLNLQKGDQVTVHGITGSINQKPVLMAHAVEAKGQRVSVKRPQDLNLKSFSGQIIKTKKTNIREGTPTVLMARIRMDDGNTTMVNMGPEKELRNRLDIQEGKRFSMLARPVKINGRSALVAEFIKIGENSVDVDWQKAKKRSR